MTKLFKQTKMQLKRYKKFIEKSKIIHNNKYDYSLVEYKNNSTKVKIICPDHGEFEQRPNDHLNGSGCPKCANLKRSIFHRHSKYEFIEKAIKIHSDKYDYSNVVYKNNSTKVKIICPIHGVFEQTPNSHLSGNGCNDCGVVITGMKTSLTNKEFIKKATLVHGDKYDYSKVEYKNNNTKVTIICPIHGEFEQTPNNHTSNHGCPMCAELVRIGSLKKYNAGIYHPKFPEKYNGNINCIMYRSTFELKSFEMIENDENIISWSSESVRIPYELNGNKHTYIVDLKLETKNGNIYLIEIKPEIQTRPPIKNYNFYNSEIYHRNMKKWMAAKKYCKEMGWEFKIWTERELNI